MISNTSGQLPYLHSKHLKAITDQKTKTKNSGFWHVTLWKNAVCHIPEDLNLQLDRFRNVKSRKNELLVHNYCLQA